MLSIYFIILIIISINFSITIQNKYENEFKQWMDEFNVIYNNIETFLERLEIFKSNSDYIKEHNEKAHVHGFTLKHNEFSNLTWNEFRSFYFGYSFSDNFLHERLTNQTQRLQEHFANENYLKDAIPESIDWVEKGGVSEVKNQGRCGSCWAFSTTGAIEGAAFVSGHELENLSEQELVDCDPADNGCNGGLMDHAFYWTENHGGLCSENDYKYEAKRGICKKSSCQSVIEVTDFHDVPANDENALKYAVAQQPVSVAIEADQRAFQFYSDGVFSAKCGTSLDHGVLVVGYGELDSKKFWKVKNSWGPTWGLNGYILLERDIDAPEGQCGVAMVPSYPIATVSKSSVKHVSKTAEVAHVQEPFDYSKQKLSFQQCGSANLIKFSQLIVDPPAPIRGKSISFKGIGKTLKQFDSASLKLQVKLGGFDIFTASKGTLCGLSHIKLPLGLGHINIDGFQCPRKMGDISEMNIQLTLPEMAPAGKYEIHLSSDNALHDQIFCTKIELSLPEHKKLTNIESPHKRQKVYEFMSEY